MSYHEKTADLLYNAVKKAAVLPHNIEEGDLLVITSANNDTIGVVTSAKLEGGKGTIILRTASGPQTLTIDHSHFIHVIQKDAMLDLRKHHEYERKNEESNQEVDRIAQNTDEHKDRPEFSVENSDKSVLPTSKISLSLRKETK